MKNIWEDEKLLYYLEEHRKKARASSSNRRLTFDCLHLKFKGRRAFCSCGKRIGQALDAEGSMDLVSVMRGHSSGTCKTCEEFITEEVSNVPE